MDKKAATKREIVLVEVSLTCALAMVCWLLPKFIRFHVWHEAVTGVTATAALIAAGYRVSLLEKEELMDRVIQAAQQDLFTSEMATEVYLEQLQQQRAIHAMMPTQPQAAQSETIVHQSTQTPSMPSTRQVAPLPSDPEVLDLNEAIHYPSIIVFGAQGSGKTTLAKEIATNKAKHGHRIQVLDPHGSDWPFPSVGGGMDYGAVEDAIVEFVGEVQQRYYDINQGSSQFHPYTVVAEEFTNWAGRLDKDNVVEFIRTAWCDTRKVDMGAIFVTHSNNLEGGLAGAKGLAQLRDAGCYQIELCAEIDPITKRPRPTGRGRLYRPGMSPVEVTVPLLMPNSSIQSVNNLNNGNEEAEYSEEEGYRSFSQPYSSPQNLHEESIQAPFSWVEGHKFMQIMQAIATQRPKHKSLESILGVKSGATKNWQQASYDWDRVKHMMTQTET